MIVLFLTGMVAMIMLRTLKADLKRYSEMETQEEAQEETGWKLVHGDVFRPPTLPMLLSVSVGTGVQVFSMSLIAMSKLLFSFFLIRFTSCHFFVFLFPFILSLYFASFL